MNLFSRNLRLENLDDSAFIFGPRMTGKTTLLQKLKADAYIDLLDPEEELRYKAHPGLLKQELEALPAGATIIIDEVQKVPALLNYAQIGIDRFQHRFLLSGSSAGKLRRGGANLLGGRALDLKLHPLTYRETGEQFSIELALQYGTLPRMFTLALEKKIEQAKGHLSSYVTTYIKEEIQAEALARNIGAFQRFIAVASQANAQVIEFANISRDCSVPASTVKEYFSILEDTLLGGFLWPFGHSERKKARPKFYFFDCGVIRALQNRLSDPPTRHEEGFLFETWFINEIARLHDYAKSEHAFSFWREKNHEIDILISDSRKPVLAIECKINPSVISAATIKAFKNRFRDVPLIIASGIDKRPRILQGIEVLPWAQALERYAAL
ncbi:MAG: AAA family ATPase [Chitinivibrionales bacterium]|nr:AAA family ATPase [Chitinivibrionales bacterium]